MTLTIKAGGTGFILHAALCAALALAGCSAPEPDQAAPATASSSATPTATPRAALPPSVGAPKISPKDREAIGADRAQSAWDFGADLAVKYGFAPDLLARDPQTVKGTDLAGVRADLTGDAADAFDKATQQRTPTALAMWGLNYEGYVVNESNPVTDVRITGSVHAQTNGGIRVEQERHANVHLTKDGKTPTRWSPHYKVTLWLTDNSGSWEVYDFKTIDVGRGKDVHVGTP